MEVVCPRRVGFRLELLGHMGSFSSILLNAESLREKVTDMSWDEACIQNLHVGVSKNNGTPKSSILIGFSIINHPFWWFSLFLETPMYPLGNAPIIQSSWWIWL